MLIHVDPGRRRSEIRDTGDLTRFSVVVAGEGTDDEVALALAPLGRLQPPDHAWISVDRLRGACAREGDAAWSGRFEAMVRYAASHGWVDGTGTELRAHVERRSGAG